MRLMLILCFYSLLGHTFAQDPAIVTGKITDSKTRESLAGATIYIDKNTGVTSDKKGNYLIRVDGKQITLHFQYIGYIPTSKSFDVSPGDTITLTSHLNSILMY